MSQTPKTQPPPRVAAARKGKAKHCSSARDGPKGVMGALLHGSQGSGLPGGFSRGLGCRVWGCS